MVRNSVRTPLFVALTGLALFFLGRWALSAYRDLRFQRELDAARRAVVARDYAAARSRLRALSRQRPGVGEVQFPLGLCERNLGDVEAALAAWSRIPRGSPFEARASVLAAREVLKQDRQAAAEVLLLRAVDESGDHAVEARQTLARLCKIQGRLREVEQLFRSHWDETPNPIAALQELWRIRQLAYPVEETRSVLEQAAKNAPNDPRIELGLGHLAIREGRFDEAERRLMFCRRAGPSDPVVMSMFLTLARSKDDPAMAARILNAVSPEQLSSADLHDLAAWFARKHGDRAAERQALEALAEVDPARAGCLTRLAELAEDPATSDRRRAREAEVNRARARYDRNLLELDPNAHLAELAADAETLGMRFEARAWARLALRSDPTDAAMRALLKRVPIGDDRVTPAQLERLVADARRAFPAPSAPPVDDTLVVMPRFVEEAGAMGLRFRYDAGRSERKQLPETMGGGVALLDYDGDGRVDVYCVQGGPFPPPADAPFADKLFRNKGDGTFEDATKESGLAKFPGGYGHGVTVGDIDNDGRPDLFVTRWRRYALYRNKGDGAFEDATEAYGLGGDRDWPTSAAFADLDGDGDLDLYVCHYLEWDENRPTICTNPDTRKPFYCAPRAFRARPDHLFRNDGGRFTDITQEAGIIDTDGRGLGVVATDLDGDGRLDLYVANDMSANFLFRNGGGLKFHEVAQEAGAAVSADGLYKAGMGIAAGDLDGDSRPDLVVGNFYGESATLYRNLGSGQFADRTAEAALAIPTRYMLTFGLVAFDAQNDGRLDLALANGHVNDLRPRAPFAMPTQLFLGTPSARFFEATRDAGPAWSIPRIGRGLAAGDLDGDGRPEIVALPEDGPLAVLRNRTERPGSWLRLKLVGTKSGTDAVGAIVTVRLGRTARTACRVGGGSYQSASDPRVHLGLGDARLVDALEITWPSGHVDRHNVPALNREYTAREADDHLMPANEP